MSSPSLPSLSSLHPVPRTQGFVTARSVLADLELQHDRDTDVIAPTEKPKRGRPKKAVGAQDGPARPRARKKTTASNDNLDLDDVDNKAPTIPKTRAIVAPAPKRGRPKKATAIEDAATTTTDTATEPTDTIDNDVAAATAGKPKPPPKPRKTKASTKSTTAISEVPAVDNAETLDSGVSPVDRVEAPIEVLDLDLDPAPRRRRDWTPPTESVLPPSFQQSSDTSPIAEPAAIHDPAGEEDTGDAPAALEFTKLMGDFAYQEDNPRPPPPLSRTPSDGPTTKRKRLDPVDVTATEAPKKRTKKAVEPKEPKAKPPKKPRAPKKKPLTITALATAAYLPQSANTDVDQTKLISDFFPQPQSDAVALPDDAAVVNPTGSKSVRAAKDKPAPKRKRAVKKVQITVPEIHVKLDSPEAARENAKRQQWLFGSSSQLAAAESPTELRDLQQALKESEDMISSQQVDLSRATSYAHVPSAPHGTSLSVGQADRVLWMSAARDFEDSTFASDESRDNDDLVAASKSLQPQYPPSSAKSAPDSRLTEEVRPQVEVLTISSSAPKELESPDSGYVDVDQIGCASPSTTRLSAKPANIPSASLKTKVVANEDSGLLETIPLDTTPETEALPRRALGTRDPNTNITRQQTDREDKISDVSPRKIVNKPSVVCLDSPEKRSVGRPRKTISNAAQTSPIVIRKVLNDSSTSLTREEARRRCLTVSPTRASLQPSQGGSHDIPPSTTPNSHLKPRGRPPKFGPAPNPVSPKRARGRPRRSASPDGLPVSSQLRKLPSFPNASSQRAAVAEPSSDYLDIDAISDIDIATHAPSPPRRLPTSPPKATLEFDRPPPTPLPTIAASTARCSAKLLLAEWPSIAPTVFPKITKTVRSTPPSQDHKAPTWHEKMLLYDPIVLEDLTLWLNGQGVRIEISVPKVVKGKGKKKADAAEAVEEATELVQEELQPWMVQKWCEEHKWWLARKNAFDTANRIYKKLYRDSDESHYSREQDYDEDEDSKDLPPLSPSSPDWNASRWFWSTERSEMWVEHVASSNWVKFDPDVGDQNIPLYTKIIAIPNSELRLDSEAKLANTTKKPEHIQENVENGPISQAEVKSLTGAELRRRPKLTIQIPSGIPTYYSKHGPNDYSSCRPHITSDERAEWRKNMF
ncbi:unnamed protein product [Aureobasidium mustum]|uniref:Structure-specific endonuclease subunit SLX4 n=1 Tax=Aureobasidium mustum TaxID=2773714 RepID=A0A9N8K2G6_9PEZI|nr:unnamed protein product [Aureobasidium mustum]